MNQKMDLRALAGATLEQRRNQKVTISSQWRIEHWRDDELLEGEELGVRGRSVLGASGPGGLAVLVDPGQL